jgi:hypothetical protein
MGKYNSTEQSPSWEAGGRSAGKIFPAFYGILRIIIVFRKIRHWSTLWAKWIHSTPCFFKTQFNITVYSHVGLGLPSGLSLQIFRSKFCMRFPCLPCVLHTLPIWSSLIRCPQEYVVKGTNCEAHYVIFSTLLLLPLFTESRSHTLKSTFF